MSKTDEIPNLNDLFSSSNAFISRSKINPYHSGELGGLTFAIKDNIDVANEITGYGSPCWANTHPKPVAHAVCLEQLLSAGAACLGKTHTDELAYSLIGINSFYGTPLNSKVPNRVPGGSSSGSASAVANELVDFAIGTDTGGSVRFPASYCGIWGYRPSHGLISVAGVVPLAPSFDTVGILANNGDVLAKVMQVLLAENKLKHQTSSLCFLDDIFQMCERSIVESFAPVISELSQSHSVEHTKLSNITEKHVNYEWLFEHAVLLLSAEVWNTFGAWVESANPKLSPRVASNLDSFARPANRKEIQNCLYKTKLFATKLNDYLSHGKILCFPTTPDLAPRIDQIDDEFLANYYPRAMGMSAISGLSRTPQITIPIAKCDDVPVGLSFIAGYGQDMMLVDFCQNLYKKLVSNKT